MIKIPITVNYGQVFVSNSRGLTVALDWTKTHFDQGFALDPDIAAFSIPDHVIAHPSLLRSLGLDEEAAG
jgi:hypothetical protein